LATFEPMIDSIIVGYGLAGFHMAWQMQQHQKTFLLVWDQSLKGASSKAAGVCNPTVLKRYTIAWNGIPFLNYAKTRYTNIEAQLNSPFFDSLPIHRIFTNEREQNDWIVASQREGLSAFLNPNLVPQTAPDLKNNAGYGIVEQLGKLKINPLLEQFKQTLGSKQYLNEVFDYSQLTPAKDGVSYKGIQAKRVIFCEGYASKANPWFNYLPLTGSKGEYLIIKAPQLARTQIIKGSIFISPLEEGLFWVGASFTQEDKTATPTPQGKEWLLKKLNALLDTPYEVVLHQAAIRPTVIDRRPLLGAHPSFSNLFIFNGLGTRGVLMAPLLSQWLYDHIQEGKQIPNEVAINRFESYFSNPK
jgi:glycine oxidase